MFDQLVKDSFVDRVEAKLLYTAEAGAVLGLARRRRECYRIIEDFRGPIIDQVYSLDGKWRYLPMREEDKMIIPNAAFVRHAAVEKKCCRVIQVLVGHEIPEFAPTSFKPKSEVVAPKTPVVPASAKTEIDWGNVADVAAKGLVVGMMGIAMISFYTLVGVLQVVDPSYCVVLDDDKGTVVELLRWNVEAQDEK